MNTNQETAALLSGLSEHVYLMTLTVRWPRLSLMLDNAKIVATDSDANIVEIDETLYNAPRLALMPKDWHAKFTNIESRCRKVLEVTRSFGSKGFRLLPIRKAEEVYLKLRELREEMNNAAEEFSYHYRAVRQELREKLPEAVYAQIMLRLPEEETIRERFGIIWGQFPLGAQNTLITLSASKLQRLKALVDRHADTDPEAVAYLQQLYEIAKNPLKTAGEAHISELLQEARDQMRQITMQTIEEMIREPQEEAARAIEHLFEMIREGRTIRTGTIDQIRRAFDTIRDFGFLADDALKEKLAQCEFLLDSANITSINRSRQLGQQLAATLRETRTALSDIERAQQNVQRFRRICLSPEAMPGQAS